MAVLVASMWIEPLPGTSHKGSHAIGRSPADITKRLDRLIDDIRSRFHQRSIGQPKASGKPSDVLLVAHGHILRAFAMRWIKRELTEGVSLLLEAGGVGTLSYEHHNIDEPAILIFKPSSDDTLTLSALDFPTLSGLFRRGLATGDQEIVWCWQNSTTYITINTTVQVVLNPAFDALEILNYGIKDIEVRLSHSGNAIPPHSQWYLELNQSNTILAIDTGDPNSRALSGHLTWSVLRDGLKALRDLVTIKNLAHELQGLQFGINSGFFGRVGEGFLS
ncbi:MAG: hypothetical protein LQ338_005823 [Usnochroma carphineum]|nr:MAG: hypothetical protein LQ338_005823 [Usnochroma carphineum]